ncbi:hypothetical protein TcCL_NonESM09054 [Trypanosoma cruzi]|nr:hypothetical protein TcCL_NonESM09054 [Trypanosoma cruzi]
MRGKAATGIPLPRDAVPKKPRRVCSKMGISPHHIRAPHAEQRFAAWDAVSCNEAGVFQPRRANDTPDNVRRSVVETVRASLGPYDPGRWTDGLSLAEHAPGSAALPLASPVGRTACGPHRAAAGGIAWPCRAERLFTKHGRGNLSILPPGSVKIAHTSSCRQAPSRRSRRSALARRRRTTTSPRRLAPCRLHWRIEVAQQAPYFPMTLRNPTQRESGR